MKDSKIVPGRFAMVNKDTGVVAVVKNMQGGVKPELDEATAAKYEAVEVSADVEPGMKMTGKGFEKPEEGEAEPPKGLTERQKVLGSTIEPRTVRNHPTKTGTPAEASNKQPSAKTKAKAKA